MQHFNLAVVLSVLILLSLIGPSAERMHHVTSCQHISTLVRVHPGYINSPGAYASYRRMVDFFLQINCYSEDITC